MCLSVWLTNISYSVLTWSSGPLGETCWLIGSLCVALRNIRYPKSSKLVEALKSIKTHRRVLTNLADELYLRSYLKALFIKVHEQRQRNVYYTLFRIEKWNKLICSKES